jgi:hypothetical protein
MRPCDAGVNIGRGRVSGGVMRLAPEIRHIYDAEILVGDPL